MIKKSIAVIFLLLFSFSQANAGPDSLENESTPIEQSDMKTIDEINKDTAIENESTPIERQDSETIEQMNESTAIDSQSGSGGEKDNSKSVGNGE